VRLRASVQPSSAAAVHRCFICHSKPPSQAMSAEAAVDAGALVQECPVLRALGAFDNLLSQGAEGVRSPWHAAWHALRRR
jgi:hypothetical protein